MEWGEPLTDWEALCFDHGCLTIAAHLQDVAHTAVEKGRDPVAAVDRVLNPRPRLLVGDPVPRRRVQWNEDGTGLIDIPDDDDGGG